jgi:hypothetical protein
MLLFFKRNFWGFLFLIPSIGCAVASFSTPPPFLVWAIIGSLGTFLSSIYCFIYPSDKPFSKIYTHENWDFGDGSTFPVLRIQKSEHRKGSRPDVEFKQGDSVFPYHVENGGDIVIVRDNNSIGRFKDISIIIRKNKI